MCQEYFYYLITIVLHNYITFLQTIYYNVDIFLFINKAEMQDSKLILVPLTFTNGRWQNDDLKVEHLILRFTFLVEQYKIVYLQKCCLLFL